MSSTMLVSLRRDAPRVGGAGSKACMIHLSLCWKGKWLSADWELVLAQLALLIYPQNTHLFVILSLQRSLPAQRRI